MTQTPPFYCTVNKKKANILTSQPQLLEDRPPFPPAWSTSKSLDDEWNDSTSMKTMGFLPSSLTTNPLMTTGASIVAPRLSFQRAVCSQIVQIREVRSAGVDAGDSGILPPLKVYGEMDQEDRLG